VSAGCPLIELKNVSRIFANGHVVALRDIDLSIHEGERISITGPSGCGKSTLLHILGALDQPTAGEVLFRGQPVSSHDVNRLRTREIGFVFQAFYLLPNLTALENVQLPMFGGSLSSAKRAEEARRLLDAVGLESRRDHLPHELSIGQRQRVAIARAIANRPSVLLADEPTGSLDSASGREVIQQLLRLNEENGTTLVIVTHDSTVAEAGQRRISMLDGCITEDVQNSLGSRENQ
jgi:ABC-type lipoprotein export system ATPase subunit